MSTVYGLDKSFRLLFHFSWILTSNEVNTLHFARLVRQKLRKNCDQIYRFTWKNFFIIFLTTVLCVDPGKGTVRPPCLILILQNVQMWRVWCRCTMWPPSRMAISMWSMGQPRLQIQNILGNWRSPFLAVSAIHNFKFFNLFKNCLYFYLKKKNLHST